jgi:hypothetical protein
MTSSLIRSYLLSRVYLCDYACRTAGFVHVCVDRDLQLPEINLHQYGESHKAFESSCFLAVRRRPDKGDGQKSACKHASLAAQTYSQHLSSDVRNCSHLELLVSYVH